MYFVFEFIYLNVGEKKLAQLFVSGPSEIPQRKYIAKIIINFRFNIKFPLLASTSKSAWTRPFHTFNDYKHTFYVTHKNIPRPQCTNRQKKAGIFYLVSRKLKSNFRSSFFPIYCWFLFLELHNGRRARMILTHFGNATAKPKKIKTLSSSKEDQSETR